MDGIIDYMLEEVLIFCKMMECVEEFIFVVDYIKFGCFIFVQIVFLDQIFMVIMDEGCFVEWVDMLYGMEIEMVYRI